MVTFVSGTLFALLFAAVTAQTPGNIFICGNKVYTSLPPPTACIVPPGATANNGVTTGYPVGDTTNFLCYTGTATAATLGAATNQPNPQCVYPAGQNPAGPIIGYQNGVFTFQCPGGTAQNTPATTCTFNTAPATTTGLVAGSTAFTPQYGFLCNGAQSPTYNPTCTYGTGSGGKPNLFTGTGTTATFSFVCNGVVTSTNNSLCTYPNPPVNGIYTGIPTPTTQFFCNGVVSTVPNAECTYPNAPVNGIVYGSPIAATTGSVFICANKLYTTQPPPTQCVIPPGATATNGVITGYPVGSATRFQCYTGTAATATLGAASTTPNPQCAYPAGQNPAGPVIGYATNVFTFQCPGGTVQATPPAGCTFNTAPSGTGHVTGAFGAPFTPQYRFICNGQQSATYNPACKYGSGSLNVFSGISTTAPG